MNTETATVEARSAQEITAKTTATIISKPLNVMLDSIKYNSTAKNP